MVQGVPPEVRAQNEQMKVLDFRKPDASRSDKLEPITIP